MKPVWTDECNVVYKGPSPEIGDLRCCRVAPGVILVTYELSDEEREAIANGGYVTVDILKEPIPPIAVNVALKDEVGIAGEHGWKIDVEPGDKLGKEEDEAEPQAEPQTHNEDESPPQGQATNSGPA